MILYEEGFKLIKEGNFQAVSIIQFLKHPQVSDDKARMLSKYNLEGVIYWEIEAEKYLPEEELKRKIDQMLNRINELTKKYPNLKIKTFLFGNEPDFPRFRGHRSSTQEQFFQNYATFVPYLKSKNKNYVIGGGGFTPESELGGRPSDWPERLLVNDNHKLSLVESTVIQGGRELSIMRPTGTPEVQLIRIKKQ